MWKIRIPRVLRNLAVIDIIVIFASAPAFGIGMQLLLSKVANITGEQYDIAFYGSFVVLIGLILYLDALVLAVLAIRNSPLIRLLEDGKGVDKV